MATDPSSLDRARDAARIIAPLAAAIEQGRRLPDEALRALVDAGVFKLLVPRAFGGSEAPATTLLAVIEAISRADGSAGWCTMIGATAGLMSAYLDPDLARAIYSPSDAITSAVFAPMGRAVAVGDGVEVRGRWSFASGCEHSSWRMGGTIVEGRLQPSGAPDVTSVIFRAEETRVIDTWDTSGLRGTGSHDFEVATVVPGNRTFSFFTDPPRHDGPLYKLPVFGVLAAGVAAVALGIARASIDALISLAQTKTQASSAKPRTLAQRELVQLNVAVAESKVRAASAFLFESVAAAEGEVERGLMPTLAARASIRLAACHAAKEAAAAVDLAYDTAGGSAIYTRSPLQRHFRDVHVATHHVMVSPVNTVIAGRVLLGLDTDTSML